jgi:uncharacterized protein (DUF1015 family)
MSGKVRPFRLLRPASDKVHLVASRSYVTYSTEELRDKLERNPFSYLHVINPHSSDPEAHASAPERGSEAFFGDVRSEFHRFLERGWLVAEDAPTVAIYRQETEEFRCTGWIVVLDASAVADGILRLHEQTLEARESLFARYLSVVGCQAEPVLVARPEGAVPNAALDAGLRAIERERPDFDFSTADRVRHTVWMCGPRTAQAFADGLSALDALYLADGHHRVASTLQVPEAGGLLAYIIPEEELVVRAYHRSVVSDGLLPEDWLARLAERPDVASIEPLGLAPLAFGEIGVLHASGQFRIQLRDSRPDRIDAGWLEEAVLQAHFGILDSRNDSRLTYIPGTEHRPDLAARAAQHPDRTYFELYPVPTFQIKSIADSGGHFPPKSTWIEPKLRSGLFLYRHGE